MEIPPGVPDPGPPEGGDDDGPLFAWLPPEDRLWRHPSEAMALPGSPGSAPTLSFDAPTPSGGRSGWFRTCAIAVVAGMVGALAASGVGVASGWWNRQTTIVRSIAPTTPSVSLDEVAGSPSNWSAVEESVAASVVSVSVDSPAGPQQGSGLVMLETTGSKAFVVTDRSLFAPDQAAGYQGTVTVTFLSGVQGTAKLIGQDPLSGLAVLEVADPARDVPAAGGSVADIREADPVLAVGARTLTGGTLSIGSVSGEDRTVTLNNGTDMDNLIAVTMPPMTPQATGGPLLDQYGRVVGLTVSVDTADTTDQEVTFAVPIDVVDRVVMQLINGQRVTHAWLGVSNAEDVPSTMAHQLGLVGGVEAGQVAPGSPASRAGIGAHDIITAFNGKPLTSTGTLVSTLAGLNPGSKVSLTYLRNGRSLSTTVHLAQEPEDG